MKLLTDIYRSPKKEGLYLYVKQGQALDELPDALLKSFGRPEYAMGLMLNGDKKLARADAFEVMKSIENQGFYLQMPPTVITDEV